MKSKIKQAAAALAELSVELSYAYFETNNEAQADMANQAATLADLLDNIWETPRHKLETLLNEVQAEPIHMIIREVLAIKAQAAQRRHRRKAQEMLKAFSLEARCKVKNHG